MRDFLSPRPKRLGLRPIFASIDPAILDPKFETSEFGRGFYRCDCFLHAGRVYTIDLANDFLFHSEFVSLPTFALFAICRHSRFFATRKSRVTSKLVRRELSFLVGVF